MWSHCKFISTDGTGHYSVNHRFESKLTQFGCETTKEGEFVRRRSYQGISSFFWKWIYHVFYHFSRLIHKVLWNPSHPDRCCPGKKGKRQGFLQMMSHDTTSTGKEGKGVKGGVTRSARSPSLLTTLYLLTPQHHLLVNVLPPPKLVWNISKSKPGHPHSSDVPFDSETSSVAENITRVNI